MFVSYCLSVGYNKIGSDLIINALGVGFSLTCMIAVTGGVSGGCLNVYVALV